MAQGQKRKADLKVVILGDQSVGKTTLIHRYMEGIFASNGSTIGASFFLKQWGPYNVAIWDTAGEERYASLSSFYCRGASAAILAYDLTRQNSLKVLKERHIPLLESAEKNCFCVIVGTKLDLVNDSTREISAEIGRSLAQHQNKDKGLDLKSIPYFETSSKSGKNVDEVFSLILNTCLPLDEPVKAKTASVGVVNLAKSRETSTCAKKKCC